MYTDQRLIVQIGGAGKGCGKTSLIVQLLEYFPGSAFVKSALHITARSPHGGDDNRCLNAGAVSAVMVDSSDEVLLESTVRTVSCNSGIVFFEKNSMMKGIVPDLYIFLNTSVDSCRDDHKKLQKNADIVLTYPIMKDRLDTIIQSIKERL